jgi:hypothetical protein
MKTLFNIKQLLHHRSKHYEANLVHPYSSKVFQQYQERERGAMVWKISM